MPRNTRIALRVVAVALLASCGAPPVPLALPEHLALPADDARRLRAVWPQVLDVCPGLARHGDVLRVDRIDAHDFEVGRLVNVVVAGGDHARLAAMDQPTGMGGQACYLGFSRGFTDLKISNATCVRICRDTPGVETAGAVDELLLPI